MQQMRLRSSPIYRKTTQNDAKRSKCTRGCRQFTAKRRKNSNYIRDSESQDSNDQTSNHENGNENERRGLHGNMQGRGQWEWKSTVQRSVLKLDVLILVNQSQTLSLAKRLKTQQMPLRLSPIHCKMPQNDAKRSKCTRGCRQFTSNYIRDSESQDSNDQTSNHENGNENERRGLHGNMQEGGQWEWKSTVQRSVLKLDMLVLVNQYQTLSLAKRLKTQQMRLMLSPICCKMPQKDAKRSKCT